MHDALDSAVAALHHAPPRAALRAGDEEDDRGEHRGDGEAREGGGAELLVEQGQAEQDLQRYAPELVHVHQPLRCDAAVHLHVRDDGPGADLRPRPPRKLQSLAKEHCRETDGVEKVK